MKRRKVPKTDSINELAEFWDTHDLTDFQSGLEEVTEPVFVRGAAIEVRLPILQRKAVQQIAQSKGVSTEALIRQWVVQKLAHRKISRVASGGR